MAMELIGGAVLGAGVSELLKAVVREKDKAMSFKPYLERLKKTLELVIPKVEEIKRIDQVDRGPELEKLIIRLGEGKILVEKCSTVAFWKVNLKARYSKELHELDNDLIRFFQLDVQAAIWCGVVQMLGKVDDIDQKMDQLTTERGSSSIYNKGVGTKSGAGAGGVYDQKATVPTNQMIITSGEGNEKLDRVINAPAALGMPLFRDDESVEVFKISSLSQRCQKDHSSKSVSKNIGDPNSRATLYGSTQLIIRRFYSSLPPISKAYGIMCLAATTAYQLGQFSPACISLLYPEFWQFQVWKLANLIFLGKFSINFGIRLLMIARYVVQLEQAMWIADFLWMMIFGSLSLLVLSTIPPFRSPFLGTSLVYVLLYVRGRKFGPGERISIFGVNLEAFYLPWVMLGMDVVFGSPLMPNLLGIIVGHLYYFLTDMHPYSSGRYIMRTPSWVHDIVAWRRFG